jgi:hypothetical protein
MSEEQVQKEVAKRQNMLCKERYNKLEGEIKNVLAETQHKLIILMTRQSVVTNEEPQEELQTDSRKRQTRSEDDEEDELAGAEKQSVEKKKTPGRVTIRDATQK